MQRRLDGADARLLAGNVELDDAATGGLQLGQSPPRGAPTPTSLPEADGRPVRPVGPEAPGPGRTDEEAASSAGCQGILAG